jgi:E3 ubiquitin-protein ligase RNF103
MWWRLLLLCIYATILFVLARILETVAFYEHGYLASRLLDPISLSVHRLKLLLDQRGIGYHGVVEKKELSELLENTGWCL